MPSISPAREVACRIATAFWALSASREPMMILTPGAPSRSASALPRFPVPPTMAILRWFSIRLSEMTKEIFRLGAEQLFHRSFLRFNVTAANNSHGNTVALSHDQFRRGCNFIGNGRHSGLELVIVAVHHAPFVLCGLQP